MWTKSLQNTLSSGGSLNNGQKEMHINCDENIFTEKTPSESIRNVRCALKKVCD